MRISDWSSDLCSSDLGIAVLRKKVAVFQQPHYLENYLQSIFVCVPDLKGNTLIIGGDGRYHNRDAIQTAASLAAANGVARLVIGQGGLLDRKSTRLNSSH